VDSLEWQVVIGNPVEEEHAEPPEAEVSAQLAEEELVIRIRQVGAYETRDRLVAQTLVASAAPHHARALQRLVCEEPGDHLDVPRCRATREGVS
jgi:hypothetical protein